MPDTVPPADAADRAAPAHPADGSPPHGAGAALPQAGRWLLVRELLVFQLKLLADGLRDIVLSPLALIAVALDLLAGDDTRGRAFTSLKRFGRRTDRWINLFGTHDAVSDRVIAAVERRVRDELGNLRTRAGQPPSAATPPDLAIPPDRGPAPGSSDPSPGTDIP